MSCSIPLVVFLLTSCEYNLPQPVIWTQRSPAPAVMSVFAQPTAPQAAVKGILWPPVPWTTFPNGDVCLEMSHLNIDLEDI